MEYRNTGRIIRKKHDSTTGGYTPICNKILQSKTLTPVQKSILVHLLSLKSDWAIRKTYLHKDTNIGRDSFRKGFEGLVELGYIVVETTTINNMKSYNYTVLEEPYSDLLKSSNTENQINTNSVSIESNNSESNDLKNNKEENNTIERIYTGANILGQNDDDIYKKRNLQLQTKYELEKYLVEATFLKRGILSFIFSNKLPDLKKKIGEKQYLKIQPFLENYLKVYNQKIYDIGTGNN